MLLAEQTEILNFFHVVSMIYYFLRIIVKMGCPSPTGVFNLFRNITTAYTLISHQTSCIDLIQWPQKPQETTLSISVCRLTLAECETFRFFCQVSACQCMPDAYCVWPHLSLSIRFVILGPNWLVADDVNPLLRPTIDRH